MDYQEIIVTQDGPVGVITLNSPHTINSLSKQMIAELIHAFQTFADKGEAKSIVIKAAGKHFCSGHNLKEMVDRDTAEYKFIFDQCSKMMVLMHEIPQVVIAQVHGIATAAGCQFVASADLAVAEEGARFATPGVRLGLFCTTPMVALSRAVGRKFALEMLLTGRMVPAHEALQHGLINRVVSPDELETVTMELARTVAEASGLTLGIGKQGFYSQIDEDEGSAYDFARNVMTMNLTTEDAQNGIKAFLEKRTPEWKNR